jgi:hypothetical protein
MMNEEDIEMSGGEEMEWKRKIYEENDRAIDGVDQKLEAEHFTRGKEKQASIKHDTESPGKAKAKKKVGRPSKARKEKEDTSDLSDAVGEAPVDVEEEEEEEAETPKAGRTKRANAGKRKRDSTTKEESEEEREVKETVSFTHARLNRVPFGS